MIVPVVLSNEQKQMIFQHFTNCTLQYYMYAQHTLLIQMVKILREEYKSGARVLGSLACQTFVGGRERLVTIACNPWPLPAEPIRFKLWLISFEIP